MKENLKELTNPYQEIENKVKHQFVQIGEMANKLDPKSSLPINLNPKDLEKAPESIKKFFLPNSNITLEDIQRIYFKITQFSSHLTMEQYRQIEISLSLKNPHLQSLNKDDLWSLIKYKNKDLRSSIKVGAISGYSEGENIIVPYFFAETQVPASINQKEYLNSWPGSPKNHNFKDQVFLQRSEKIVPIIQDVIDFTNQIISSRLATQS